MKRILSLFVCIFLLLSFFGGANAGDAKADSSKKVLYINSYHKGYKWSDDILEGIHAQLFSNHVDIELDIEYLDTQRITDESYLKELRDVFAYKYKSFEYDLIIASDDAAFNLLNTCTQGFFDDVPTVFCGVNYFEDSMIRNREMMTGVVEGYQIGDTLDIALNIHPDVKNVYYMVDSTITGQSVAKEFMQVKQPFEDKLNFIQLDGKNLNEIKAKAKTLPQNSIILYLLYFVDNEGNHYEYDEGIAQISKNSSVPVYGLSDYLLGNGIVGGMLSSGYYQGATAAQMALRILSGEKPADIAIITEETSHAKFDYDLLQKHGIPLEKLPADSIIINHDTRQKKQILILNSYHKGLQWTDDIERGIEDALGDRLDGIEFTYEYMDNKRSASDPVNLHKVREFLKDRYTGKSFDLVITTDDEAFRLVRNYSHILFVDTPVVFCGVNYFEDTMIEGKDNITGVVESNDMQGNLDIALKLHPETERIIVINDTTLTGRSNKKRLDEIIHLFEDRVTFEYWSDVNMTTIQEDVKLLGDEDLILLMAFNRDKSYNTFSFDECIKLVSENAPVPVYGLWDFYLGKGLTGGKLMSGYIQGQMVGDMVLDILDGKAPKDIPVIKENVTTYMFDHPLLKRHGADFSSLPKDSIIINKPFSMQDFYEENKTFFYIGFILIGVIIILTLIVRRLQKNLRDKIEKEHLYAITDALTGIKNRRACFDLLQHLVALHGESGVPFSIAFMDMDGLKAINDNYGHSEGDEAIKATCRLIERNLDRAYTLCRMGGDEFVIVYSATKLPDAKQKWQAIQSKIDAFNAKNIKPYDLNVSVGFAQYDEDKHHSIDALIGEADSEMYAVKTKHYEDAKREGKYRG